MPGCENHHGTRRAKTFIGNAWSFRIGEARLENVPVVALSSGNTFRAIIEYAEVADNTAFGLFHEGDTLTCHYLRGVRTGK